MGINDQLAQRIQANAAAINADQMAKSNAANKLSGAAAVARGESLKEVKENAPFVERIFGGGATQAGAEEMYLQQSVNQYITDANNNMKQLREITPEEFAAQQIDVFSSAMTGDKALDDRLMAMGRESIRSVVASQQQHHLVYQQEQSRDGFNARVMSSLEAYNSAVNASNSEGNLKLEAGRLFQAVQRQEGHDEIAHKDQMVSFIRAGLMKGDSTLYDVSKQMDLPLNAEDIMRIEASRAQYYAAVRKKEAVELANAQAEVAMYSEQENADPEVIMDMIQDIEFRWGEGTVGDRAIGWLTKHVSKQGDKLTEDQAIQSYADGLANDIKKSDAIRGLIGYRKELDRMVASNEISQEQADAYELTLWMQNTDVEDPSRIRKWNTAAGMPIDPRTGEVSQAFATMMRDSAPYFKARPEKVAKYFSDPVDLQRVLAIQRQMQFEGATLEQATRMWQDKQDIVDAEAMFKDTSFRNTLDDLSEQAVAGDMDVPGFFDAPAARDRIWVKSRLREIMKQIAGRSGSTENLKEAATAMFQKQTEYLRGEY